MSMTRTRFLCLSATMIVAAISFCGTACKTAETPKWKAILDASHTNGWRMTGPGAFKWEKGELVTYGGMGLFYYEKEKFADCQIRVVFKLTGEEDNSGVFIRIPHIPKDPWDAVHHGYEVQIANKGDEWHRTGTVYSFTKAKVPVEAKVGQWSTMIITLKGNRTMVEIDGNVVTDYIEGTPVPEKKIWYEPERRPRPDSGYIGLQNHGGNAHVHFKEVSVAPLK